MLTRRLCGQRAVTEEAKAYGRYGRARVVNPYQKEGGKENPDLCLTCEREICPGDCDEWRRARNERKDGSRGAKGGD